jgi:hypothetical protein
LLKIGHFLQETGLVEQDARAATIGGFTFRAKPDELLLVP